MASSEEIVCLLCRTVSPAYQFRNGDFSFYRCNGCGLLLTQPLSLLTLSSKPAPVPDVIRAYALSKAASYRGRALRTSAFVAGPLTFASDETFDTIVVTAGLDRAEDPVALLERVAAHIAVDGALVLLAPSTTSLEARAARAKWSAFRSGARAFFSPDTLQSVATRSGFGDFDIVTDARSQARHGNDGVATWFDSNAMIVCRRVERQANRTLSVIMPVYNEARTVERSLRCVLDKAISGIDIEAVVVENGSTDGSKAILDSFASHPRVKLISLERARGKGFAVRAGLEHARGEVVLIQDADLEYDVDDYDRLVEPLFAFQRNVVLGSRHDAAGSNWKVRYFDSEPTLTNVLNFGHVVLTETFNRIYHQRLNDPFTMFKVFRRDCLYGLNFECDRFDFDLELLIKLIRKGYRPFEIAVNYRSRPFREGKKISLVRDPIDWLSVMFKYRRSA